ncbi:MAG TPA: S49 family peptidase [Burkholderiales bacterium]|nr:S49 family peptidase [Burkholderiales bacterium]
MADNDGQWERAAIERLAGAALQEQRRARRWGLFFKLLTFAYITVIILMAMDWGDRRDTKGKHTALVEVNGVIAPGTDASAERVMAALQAAFKDENTQGVVVRINSPGGSPVQSNYIYEEMRRLRKKHPAVPLYAVVEDLCASGGYYVAAGADRIYVGRSSIVGSIGVRMDSFGVTGLMDKLGVERRLLTAGDNKGFLDPFLPVDPAQKAHAQALLEEVHRHFIDAVRDGRGQRLKESPEMFSGLIWTGQKSVELGLADALGSLDYVAREVVKAEKVVDYTQKENLAEKFARRLGAGAANALLEFALRGAAQPR